MRSRSSPGHSGLSLILGERCPDRKWPQDPGAISRDLRCGRKAYGVDRYIIAAIWGVETNYSTAIGERSVVRSTGDARVYWPPAGFLPRGVLSALEIVRAGDLRPEQLKGSWAARSARPSSCDIVSSATRSDFDARPPRRGRHGSRFDCLDGEQPQRRTEWVAGRPGARGGGAAGFELPSCRSCAHLDDARYGARRHPASGR